MNQNTITILLLEADNRQAHHARRTAQAQARHSRNTSGTWTATPEGIRPPIHAQSPSQLYRTADTAVFLALRARHQSSAQNLFNVLMSSARADHQHRTLEAIASEAYNNHPKAQKLKAEAQTFQATAYAFEQLAKDPSTTEASRTLYQMEATRNHKKSMELYQEAHEAVPELKKLTNSISASDREPLVHEAIIQALAHDHQGNPDGAFQTMCRRAGQAIADIASPDSATSTRTKVKEITPEEAEQIRKAYPDRIYIDPQTGLEYTAPCHIPHNVKGATSQCYDTIEQRERGRGKEKRLVWCKVSHYLTIAPYISYEAFTEASGGDTAEMATNGGINAIGTQEDQSEIADLLQRANLTEREQAIVYRVADQTSARHAQTEAEAYWKKRTPEIQALPTKKARARAHKEAQTTADNVRISAQWTNAFERTDITSQTNRDKIKSRIKGKLTEATKPAEPLTPEEQAEREEKRWTALQRNGGRGYNPEPAKAPDFIGTICPEAVPVGNTLEFVPLKGWTYRPTKSARVSASYIQGRHGHKPVILWTESEHSPEPIGNGIDTRAVEVLKRDQYRQTAPKATPPEMTERERNERKRLDEADKDTQRRIAQYEAYILEHPWLA